MPRPLLVLVRWKGDIIATYDAVPPAAPLVSGCEGVRVEVYDVAAERAALELRPRLDLRPIAGFLASAALHAAVAAAVLLVLTGRSRTEIDADQRNDQGAALHDYITRIAANENASEKPRDERAPSVVDEQARPEPVAEPVAAPEPAVAPAAVVAAAPLVVAEVAQHGSAGHDPISTSPSVCTPPKGGPGQGPRCQRRVVVVSIETRPSCFVDTVAKAGQEGTLTFPCSGDGEATLTFGNRSFTGSEIGGNVNVCTGTEYPWKDGCTWTSAQRVTGSIASGTLQFAYGESPKPGEHGCAGVCEAHGVVRVKKLTVGGS